MVVLEDVAAMEATALSRGCCWILLEADADARLPVSTEVSLCMRKNGKNFKYECQTCFVEKKYLFNEVCTQIFFFAHRGICSCSTRFTNKFEVSSWIVMLLDFL